MDEEGGEDSGKVVRAVVKLFPRQRRELPLNQPGNCLVLLGWNVAVTTRPDGTQHSMNQGGGGEGKGGRERD